MTIADPPPTVSVVTATYNRSYVLRHALRSVLAQDFADFEVLVIGDACTDDTAEVVASFSDPRVTFVNLPINFGDQSGPNNVGIAWARGRYLAFLNHDDLWFPDHLSTLLAWLDATGADMVHSPCAGFFGRDDSWTAGLAATGARPVFDPFRDLAPASTWLVTAELFRKVGVFRPAAEMATVPTQEFLFRVWRRGFVHRIVPSLTVLGIASVSQKHSYLVRESPEHELAARLLFERPSFRSELLERIGGQRQSRTAHVRQALRAWLMRPLAWAGIAPPFPAWRHSGSLRRGSEIEHLRKLRGLDRLNQPSDLLGKLRAREIAVGPRYPLGKRVYLGIGGSDFRVKEWGWSFADRDGTWTMARTRPLASVWKRCESAKTSNFPWRRSLSRRLDIAASG